MMTTRASSQRRHLPNSPFRAQPERVVERFAVDDRVTHDKYGLGRVISADDAAVTVDFGAQQVRITTPFDKLSKL